ncbi:Homeobox protein YOX1 [Lachnellula suecica]|uniref:Homeobox protein YOX1 n=1 Tax=Lachnellula suecica TaxID=602035 RepID=A0A8T9CKV4_9HELO|nr:Homeobox protein YOX1 [Lachnellula suecica]
MSDATLPPPRSSPVGPASEGRERSNSSQSQDNFDVSGEQSSDPATGEGASGESETRAENKQRRKRTRHFLSSPSDQAILEAEYKLNPKPSKAARAEIVEKVTLNEKEVQIWFQNRRQINRRKSRPLLPHEIAAFGLGGMAALSSDPAPIEDPCGSQSIADARTSSQQRPRSSSQEDVESLQDIAVTEAQREKLISEAKKGLEDDVVEEQPLPTLNTTSEVETVLVSSSAESSSFSATEILTKSFSSTPGYLANRWNASYSSQSTPTSSQAYMFSTPPITNSAQPSSCPERIGASQSSARSSQMRLSMSIDGKAELISDDPSPPRTIAPRPSSSAGVGAYLPQKRMRTLQRSQSALPFGPLARQSVPGAPFPRLPTGRSRDARSWEFCCDPEIRDELTTFAENESNGSAVAAISLLRSTSNAALKPNSNKRNAPTTKYDSSKQLGKKPKLGRAQSSLARLQTPHGLSSAALEKLPGNNWKDGLMRSPSGDSDKENWLPNENAGNPRRRPLPSARADGQFGSRSALGDNHKVLSHAMNLGGNRRRKAKDVETMIFEDKENAGEGDADVEKFMRGEISPGKKGDLDCVQGLLSLSQGNWR